MLEAEGIRKNYGKKTVLSGVSLTAEPGQCVGIVGGNGCGKTTLLSILAGAREGHGELGGRPSDRWEGNPGKSGCPVCPDCLRSPGESLYGGIKR